MTARDRIRAEACPQGCAKGIPLSPEPKAHRFEYMTDPEDDFPCTAPTDEQIIERLAGEVERLNVRARQCVSESGVKLSNPSGEAFDELSQVMQVLIMENGNSAKGLKLIAAALSLPPEAGVEEIVERAKAATAKRAGVAKVRAVLKETIDRLETLILRGDLATDDRDERISRQWQRNAQDALAALDAARRQG